MTDPSTLEQLSVLKDVAYVDKVYAGIADFRARLREPLTGQLDLRTAERRVFSQNGEDGIIIELVRTFSSSRRHFVEFGVGDGWSCNTRLLAEVLGWDGVYFEIDDDTHGQLAERYVNSRRIRCIHSAVTPDNINELFAAANVPDQFFLLSIDIDGQDYWVWKALGDQYRPDIVVAEVNLAFGLEDAVTEVLGAPQSPLTATYGASISAMRRLGESKGYRLVHVEMAGVNAFFVREDLLDGVTITGITDRSPNYGLRGRNHSPKRVYGDNPRVPRPTTAV